MLTYLLDPTSRIPLYEQLYTAIRQDIMSGTLCGGEKLPSKRQLATHLKLSTVTIETAYGQLMAEGYVHSRPKRGYFVQTLTTMPTHQAHSSVPCATAPAPAPTSQPSYLFDFRTNTVDTACFPFATWARLLRSVLTEQASELLRAPHPQGVFALREQIRQYLYRFRGIAVETEQIIVGAGSEYLSQLLIQLLGRDKLYALETPGYAKLHHTFVAGGARVVSLPLDEQGLREDALQLHHPDIVYLTPSHQFPLGIVTSAARRTALLRWAAQASGRYLIEDDYDSEFRYASRPIPALKSLDHTDRVIYLNTFAQSLAPSLRIGYAVLPKSLIQTFQTRLGFYSSTVPSFEQYTLAKFMQTGAFERHINRSRNLYRARRDALVAAIAGSALADFVTLSGLDAGLHLLLHVHNGMTERALIERAAQQQVRVYGLSAHDISHCMPRNPPIILLGYAGIAATDFAQAVACLARAWCPSNTAVL